jgi:predicted DsbA family dithiol-disulfide isomerase
MRVDIWSDVVCPWCYVGKARFEKALGTHPRRDEVEVEVTYHSFELDPSYPRDKTGKTNLQMLSEKYGMSPAQAREADGKVASLAQGVQPELVSAVNEAYFAKAERVFDASVLADVAAGAGLDRAAVAAVLNGDAFTNEVRQDVRARVRGDHDN